MRYRLEVLTVSRFLEAVIRIVMRGVNVYRMSKFLQAESSIDDKAFGTPCKDVSQMSVGDFTTATHRFRGPGVGTQCVMVVWT